MTLRIMLASVVGVLALGTVASAQDAGGATAKVDFEKQIWPILERSCIECHQATYKDARGRARTPRASLRLDGHNWIMAGSHTEKVVIPGDGEGSLLYILTTLQPGEDGFMPKNKKPLAVEETELLKRWIDEGANFGGWVGAGGPDPVKVTNTAVEASIPVSMSPIVELGEGLSPLPTSALTSAAGPNGRITPATRNGPLLRVTYYSNQNRVDDKDVTLLLPVRERVTQLILGRTGVTDRSMGAIGSMKRLTKLDLSETKVTDRGLGQITRLGALRSLNLYGTEVSDRGLVHLERMKSLEKIYLWETKVTEAGVAKLRQALPRAKIIRVLVVPPPEERGDGNNRRRRRND